MSPSPCLEYVSESSPSPGLKMITPGPNPLYRGVQHVRSDETQTEAS